MAAFDSIRQWFRAPARTAAPPPVPDEPAPDGPAQAMRQRAAYHRRRARALRAWFQRHVAGDFAFAEHSIDEIAGHVGARAARLPFPVGKLHQRIAALRRAERLMEL